MRPFRRCAIVLVALGLLVVVSPSTRAGFVGTLTLNSPTVERIDANGNGLYDTLLVNVTANVVTPGIFEITAQLVLPLPTGSFYGALNGTDVNLSATGPVSFSFPLSTAQIGLFKIDGPYGVQVSAISAHLTAVDVQGATPAWNASEFDGPVVRLGGPITDEAVDVAGDGAFDEIVVHVPFEVLARSPVLIEGSLQAYGSPENAAPQDPETFDPGNYTWGLVFDAVPLRMIRLDGPYTVSVTLVSGDVGLLGQTTHATAAYSSATFARPEAVFRGAATASLSDTNGNGQADLLVLQAPLHVRREGTFYLTAAVWCGSSCPVDPGLNHARYVHLTAGDPTVELDYSGITMNRLLRQAQGPVTVSLVVRSVDHPTHSDATQLNLTYDSPSLYESPFPVELTVNVLEKGIPIPCGFVVVDDPVTKFEAFAIPQGPQLRPGIATLYNGTFNVVTACPGSAGGSVTVSGPTVLNLTLPSRQYLHMDFRLSLDGWDHATLTTDYDWASESIIARWLADQEGNADGIAEATELALATRSFNPSFGFDLQEFQVDGIPFTALPAQVSVPSGVGTVVSATDLVTETRTVLVPRSPMTPSVHHSLIIGVPVVLAGVPEELMVQLPPGGDGNLSLAGHYPGFYGGFSLGMNATATKQGTGRWSVTIGATPSAMPYPTWTRITIDAFQGPIPPLLSTEFIVFVIVPLVAVVAVLAGYVWLRKRGQPPPEGT